MNNDDIGYEAMPGSFAGKTKKIKRPGRIRIFFRGLVELWKMRRHIVVFQVDAGHIKYRIDGDHIYTYVPAQFICVDSNGEIFTNDINCERLLMAPAWHTLFVSKHMKKKHNASPVPLGDALILAEIHGLLTEETKRRWIKTLAPKPPVPKPEVKGERAK